MSLTTIYFPHATQLILDFGSQYTQLIARRVRELNIFCEIFPYNHFPSDLSSYKAVILRRRPHPDLSQIRVTHACSYMGHNT
jgi:hypothetical protein